MSQHYQIIRKCHFCECELYDKESNIICPYVYMFYCTKNTSLTDIALKICEKCFRRDASINYIKALEMPIDSKEKK